MQCEVEFDNGQQSSFEELKAAMLTQQYWLRFFVRPCCPAPGMSEARKRIEHLKSDIDARGDMTPQQRAELKGLADEHLEWYSTLNVRHGK
ncbi:MAG: hypothetical protein ACI36W_06305 [Coriobacteriales bacterium]